MGKIKNFCKRNGINLKTPKGWAQFFRRCMQFAKKNKGHLIKSACLKIAGGVPSGEREQEPALTYANIRAACVPKQRELGALAAAIPSLKRQISFTAVVMAEEWGEPLEDLLWDVKKQILPAKEVLLCGGRRKEGYEGAASEYLRVESTGAALAMATGDYVLFLREGDRLERETLFEMAFEINRRGGEPVAVYTDHDVIGKSGYGDPFFKPGYSPELLLAYDYVCGAYAARREALAQIELNETLPVALFLYDVLLKLAEAGSMYHVAGPLFHLKDRAPCAEDLFAAVRREALARRGGGAVLRKNEYGNPSAETLLRGEPLVSIIIPTCYAQDHIEKCLDSVYGRTSYKNYEVIVADNSRKPKESGEKRLKKYAERGCRILYVNEPFNWARLNNLAAKEAKGELFLFLNDDTEIITPDWLQRMAAEAARPDVGEVGPLLLFPDGTVQEAGMFLAENGGGAKHWFFGQKEDCRAYRDLLHFRRECSFVTGACAMVERKKFEALGGFDERFAVVSNDAEFGLRLREAGFRNLYLPDVKITHDEKSTRGKKGEAAGEKLAWEVLGEKFCLGDEYFNVYFDRYEPTPVPDVYPPRAMLTGSPTIARNLIKRILLVKLDHIGDNIIAFPAVRKIRSLFPDARIDMLCAPWFKGLWEAQPEIDRVITYEFFTQRSQDGVSADEKELKELMSALKKEHYDLSVHLRRHEETKFIAAQAADYCLAFSGDPEYDEIAFPVPAMRDKRLRVPKWSMRDQLMSLADYLDGEPSFDRPVEVSDETKQKMRAFAAQIPQFSAPIVVGIHAGAGSDFRQWGAQKFARLCNLILSHTPASVVLFGGKGEIPINEEILSGIADKSRAVSVAGMQNLLEFCELVKYTDYFIGNNSGPKHISGIQGVPTLSIDGLSAEQEWSAPGPVHMSVRKVMNCAPCPHYMKEQCPKEGGVCLIRLGAGDVWRALERLMLLYPKHKGEQNG